MTSGEHDHLVAVFENEPGLAEGKADGVPAALFAHFPVWPPTEFRTEWGEGVSEFKARHFAGEFVL